MSEQACQPDPPPQDWASVCRHMNGTATQMAGDATQVIANALHLAEICKGKFAAPQTVGKGYWDTVTLQWKGIEVEVFRDHLELYLFHSKGLEIEHFNLTSDGRIPRDFLSALRFAFYAA